MWPSIGSTNELLFIFQLLLIVGLFEISVNASSSASLNTAYFSYYMPITTYPSMSNTKQLKEVLVADDSPFQLIKLPFDFHIFDNLYSDFFVNPNGALHISAHQPCSCACFWDYSCNWNTSYNNVIAGYLTDLYPYNSSFGNITYGYNSNLAIVTFSNIQFFGSSVQNSFQIGLYKDNRVEFQYNSIDLDYNFRISGIIFADPLIDVFLTSNQLDMGLKDWSTTTPGVYPSISKLAGSPIRFVSCPVSVTWCAQPSNFVSTFSGNITLTPLSISCLDEVNFAIVLRSTPTSQDDLDQTFVASSASMSSCSLGSTVTDSLTCSMSPFSSFSTPNAYYLSVFWRRKLFPNDAYVRVPINDTVLYLKSTATAGSCALNNPLSSCPACNICQRNLTCLALPCDNSSYPVLYKEPTCSNVCETTLIPSYNSTNNCCDATDLDCNGVCFGSAVVAKSSIGSAICCLSGSVDCAGVCDGKAKYDACGVCGGPNSRGIDCNNGIKIDTGYADSNFYPVVDLSKSSASTIASVTISNNLSFALKVSFQVIQTSNSVYPFVTVPSNSYNISAHTSKSFNITVSLSSMTSVTDDLSGDWEVKSLQIIYHQGSISYYTLSDIYIAATGCSIVTDQSTCMLIPGCMYCTDYSAYRSLLAVDETDTEGNRGAIRSHREVLRRAFVDIVPSDKWTSYDADNLPGTCRDGNSTSLCPLASTAVTWKSTNWLTTVTTALIVTITMLWG